VVGPFGLDLVGDAEQKIGIAELGIVLLLFIVGLELNPARLWRMKREIFGLGLLQVVLCGLALTGVILLASRFSWAAALALGLPLSQDLCIMPLITSVAAWSRNPIDGGGSPGWVLVLLTLAAMAGLIVAGRYLIQPLFRLIGGLGEREMFVVAALFTVVAA